jgi:TP901 family phage tail tape measure protein
MADSIIGALRVVLGLDTAAFSSGAKEAQSTLDKLASNFKSVASTLAAGLTVGALVTSVQHAINSMDELGKSAQKIGIPVEQLSGLKYAAELADVSMETLSTGVGKLSKAMVEGAAKPTSAAAKAFQELGVSVKDSEGNMRPTNDVLLELAGAFAHLEDDSAKTAAAIALFGRGGKEMIPFLNQGKAGINDLTAEAKEFGLVISDSTAKQAEQFNDTLKSISAHTQGLFTLIAAEALPTLNDLASRWKESSKESGFFESVLDTTKTTLQEFNAIVTVTSNIIDNLKAVFGGVKVAVENYDFSQTEAGKQIAVVTDAFKAAKDAVAGYDLSQTSLGQQLQYLSSLFDSAEKGLADTTTQSSAAAIAANALSGIIQNLGTSFSNLAQPSINNANYWLGTFTQTMNEVANTFKGKLSPSFAEGTNAVDNFIKSQQKAIASAQAQAATIGSIPGTFEAMKVSMDAAAIAAANNTTLTDAQRVAIKNLSDQAMAAAMGIAGAQLTQEFLDPWDKYAQKIRDVNALLADHKISAQTAQKASYAAATDMTKVYGDAAAGAMGNFATFFTTFAQGNAEMFAIAKAFSISQAIINTYTAATAALKLPPPLGYIAAAGVIAAGMAMVATIIAQKPAAKMALGGSFMVGGAGGTDTQMVPIMATPGERVSVDQNKYGESSGSAKTITLQGLKPKEYYRGDVLRDFVDNLNQAIGDGLKIKLA